MLTRRLAALVTVVAVALSLSVARAEDRPLNTPPAGFTNLFNGKDLAGWLGRQQGVYSPVKEAELTPKEHAKKQAEWNADRDKNWSVDAAKGEIVSTGHGVHLVTEKEYRDVEFYVNWLMVNKNGDSGIYLRDTPQVQVWDPENPNEVKNGAPKGSGGLWNNHKHADGKFPLVKADNPVGQWNTFHIKMVGDRVWVWLNDKLTVNGSVLDNYFDPTKPLPTQGRIELQTHGSEIRFRNIYLRELPTEEANALLQKGAGEGFTSLFNGKDLEGWAGATDNYTVENGAIRCKPGKGGVLHTKDEYADFEATLEFKLPPAGNNGLAIRYPGSGDTAYVGMCEIQVLDDTADQYKKLDPRQYCGSVYGVSPAVRGHLRPVGEWNFYHVTVKGHHIIVELNGAIINDVDVSTVKEFAAKHEHPGLMRDKGSFGFAGHSDPVEFRNVSIKKLD